MAKTTKSALEEARAYAKSLSESKKVVEEMEKGFGDIANAIAGLSMEDFFQEVSKSEEEIKKITQEFTQSFQELSTQGTELGEKLKTELAGGLIGELKKVKDVGILDEEIFKKIESAKDNAEDLAKIYGKYAKELDTAFIAAGGIEEDTRKTAENYLLMQSRAALLKKEMQETSKIEIGFGKALLKISENIIKSVIPTISDLKAGVMSMDQVLTASQKNSGIEMKKNADAMRSLSVNTSIYGISLEAAAGFMSNLGDSLNTTNFNLLKTAAEDTKAISVATGLSYENVGQLTGNFMLAGKSSKSVANFTEKAMIDSAKFGLNVKKVLEDVNKNYVNFRKLGFQGGEESLKRMVITAQRLRMNVDEIFNVAQRARSIEGAMEMAAELQLAGGSFAQIDPMQLLAAARKSPEELTKILGKMGQDIGKFNKETGGVDFDAVDADRLAMVAQATGLTVENLQNQITKGKQRIEKEGKGLFSGFAGGLDSETKDMLDQFSTIGADGQIKFEGAFAGMDINELRGLTQAEIQQKIKDYNQNKKSLEEQARQNQSFNESVANLKTSILNAISVFQPIINGLTEFIVDLNQSLPEWAKIVIGGLGLLLVTFFGPAAAIAKGYLMGKGFNIAVQGGSMFKALTSGIGGMFGFGGGGGGGANIKTPKTPGDGKGFAGFMRGLRDGFAAWGTKSGAKAVQGALYFGVAMAAAVTPLMLVSGVYKALGGSFTDLALLGLVLVELAGSLALMSYAMKGVQMGGIMQGVLALTLLNIPLLAFAGVASLFSNIDWESFAKMAVVMVGGIAVIAGLGALMNAGGLAFVIAGAAGLIIAAAAIGAFGLGLLVASTGFQAMANIDWNGLSGMALTLFSLAPAILAFAAAGLLLLNPLMLLGMVTMVAALGSLAFVMSILGPNLEKAGNGMKQMGEGVEKLSTALSKISDDTLDKLKSIGENIGDAAALTAAVNALNTATSGGGGGGTPQKFQIEVIVKGEDGRTLQRRIVKDTDLIK